MKPLAMPNGDPASAWNKRPDGTMEAECGPLQLLAHPPAWGAYARFVVLRRAEQGQRSGALLQSGSRDGLEAAIHGAEAAARCLIATLEPPGSTRP